jgi:hypothetical protein
MFATVLLGTIPYLLEQMDEQRSNQVSCNYKIEPQKLLKLRTNLKMEDK